MNIFKKYLLSVRYNYAYLVGLLLFIIFSLPIFEITNSTKFILAQIGAMLLGVTGLGLGSYKQYKKHIAYWKNMGRNKNLK